MLTEEFIIAVNQFSLTHGREELSLLNAVQFFHRLNLTAT